MVAKLSRNSAPRRPAAAGTVVDAARLSEGTNSGNLLAMTTISAQVSG